MADIDFIRRLHFQEGWPVRRIAREFHVGRNTITKYLDRTTPLIEPAYVRTSPPRAMKMDRYRERIDAWLTEDLTAPRDQRHTAHRIYQRLVNELQATDLVESSVRRYVRLRRAVVAPKPPDVFLHLEVPPGGLSQIDWGDATIRLAGVDTKVMMFAMRLGYSTRPFVRLYPNARMECFLDGHIRAFEFYGGLAAQSVYDNLSSAVKRVLSRRGRALNPTFASFVAHYLFEPVFANVASGWEKGLVEGLVGYARRNYLVPVPNVDSIEQANAMLCERLEADLDRVVPERAGRTVRQLFEDEREQLMARPPSAYPACTRHTVHVSHQATVRHQMVQYSVPARLVGRTDLELRAFYAHVEVYDRTRLVASHALGQSGGPPVLELDHYLDVLVRKPGGVRHARVVNQLGKEVMAYRDDFLRLYPDAYGTFVKILMLSRSYTLDAVVAGIRTARAERIYDVARVEALIAGGLLSCVPQARSAPVPAGPVVNQPSPGQYDALLAAAAVIA